MNKKLIEALDKLIEKYTISTKVENSMMSSCPLCQTFYPENRDDFENRCIGCPNSFFNSNPVVACANRVRKYSALNYADFDNYPTLKQFWTDYKELYLTGMSNEEIMTKLVEQYKNSNE